MSQASGETIHAAISYSRADQSRVEQLLASLKGRGLSIWFDKDIPGGALWEEIIARKYRACGALLFFVSKASLDSQRCSEEVSTARTLGKPIIPVLLDPLKLPDDLPDRFVLTLQARNTVDAFERPQAEVEGAILAALEGFGITPGAPLRATPPTASASRTPVPPASAPKSGGGNGLWFAIGGAFTALALVIAAYVVFVGGGDEKAPAAGSVAATATTTAATTPTATAQPAAPPEASADSSTPVEPPPAASGAARMTIGEGSYPVGVAITAKIADVPGDERDYVAVARANAKPEETVSTVNTGGATAKSLTLKPVMKAGDYELRLFYGSDETPVVRASVPFKVTPPGPVTLTLGKESYAEGERIQVAYTGLPGNERDWVSVALADAPEGTYIAYEYSKGEKDGSIQLRPMMKAGEYEIRAFFDDTTGDKTVRARQTFLVTPAPAIVATLDAPVYEPGKPIKVTFSGMPGNERDWFSVAKADSGDSAYVTYVYTKGDKAGEADLTAPAEHGDYEIRAYFDDSTGDKTVRVRLPFKVGAVGAAAPPSAD